MKPASERIILGIDPGTVIMGYGIIIEQDKVINLEAMGVLRLAKYTSHELRLKLIFDRVLSLIDRHHPDALAIEAPFYGKNVQSMLKLGRSQGVAMAASLYRDIPVFEYSSTRIKQSITGNGRASKEMVAAMMKRLLKLQDDPESFDATDALAVAVCHSFQKGKPAQGGDKVSGWEAFLKQNPDRLK